MLDGLVFCHQKSVHTHTSNRIKKKAMNTTNNRFSIDDLGFIQLAMTEVLAAVARGELDLNRLAREELANRGLDAQGQWVGFDRARDIHQLSATR